MAIVTKSGNPKFVTAAGMAGAMQLEPPFDFDGVTMRVFPLRASLSQKTSNISPIRDFVRKSHSSGAIRSMIAHADEQDFRNPL